MSLIWKLEKVESRCQKLTFGGWWEDNFNLPLAILLYVCNNRTGNGICYWDRGKIKVVFNWKKGFKNCSKKKFISDV